MRRAIGLLAAVVAVVVASLAATSTLSAQEADRDPVLRPSAHPIVPTTGYRRAVEAGTRTADGSPGTAYWQQEAAYELEARLDARARRLEGSGRILYRNRSPDTLDVLHLHLHQNLHAPGTVRNEPQELTGGVELDTVAVDGTVLSARGEAGGADDDGGPGYSVDATILTLRPAAPVPPGDSVRVRVDWAFDVPRSGAGRMGWSEDLMFLAYWYPQMAVYDDVVGWHTDPYRGRAEFYMGFADYDVRLTVPEGWVVRATGSLENPAEVLPPAVRERLRRAGGSDTVVHVLGAGEFGPGTATVDAEDDRLTWHFRAADVRDFAFSATRRSRWDAARAPVGDRDGDGAADHTRVEALWRSSAPRWSEVWRYERHAIDFLSRYTGLPYPWPHMTAVEGGGIIGGGMEFPMMTLMGDYEARGDSALYYVTAHELAHMWIPMRVGTDEKRYAWMDEGTTTFHENRAREEFFPDQRADVPDMEDYLEVARAGDEVPVMRWMDYQYPPAGNVPNYDKPATVLVALREIVGEEVFREALTTFQREWDRRHPYPWDFFRTVERAAGRDLDWFWRSWFYETWTLDHAIGEVRVDGRNVAIRIVDRGWAPMPVPLAITLESGVRLQRELGVDPWLDGEVVRTLEMSTPDPVVRIEIDPERRFPDLDRTDNVWTREDDR